MPVYLPSSYVPISCVRLQDGKLGAQRFLDLVQGKEGVGYRRSRINLLQDVSSSQPRPIEMQPLWATCCATCTLCAPGLAGCSCPCRQVLNE